MSRKILILFCLIVLTFSSLGASSFAVSFSPALSVISHDLEIDVCGLVGNPVSFSDELFKNELGSKLLGSVKLSSLPDESFGSLTHDGKALGVGDMISVRSLNKLKFIPKTDTPSSGNFSLSVSSCGINYDVVCSIHILDRLNFAPVGYLSEETLTTFSGVCTYGQLNGTDPDGDAITFEISSHPKKGILTLIDAKKGRYVYSPYKSSVGDDSFEYTVKDEYGNRSSAVCVNISLTQIDSKDVYSDMKLEPSAYWATLLSELDIFRGERVGGNLVFSPQKTVCLEDFLMMSMSYAKISPISHPSSSPYTDTALTLGFLNPSDELEADSIITTAEAAQIIERIINSENPDDEYVFAPNELPSSSLERLVMSYPALFSLEGIPNTPLSRANAVSLVAGCIPRDL